MAKLTKSFTLSNEEGEEIEIQLPCKKEVCPECDGEGHVLCEGMRGHAYSAEEFAESFDSEEAEEYFRPGGRYDVQCPECHGKNVVDVVDEEACQCDPQLKEQLAELQEHWARQARYRAEAYERRMGY